MKISRINRLNHRITSFAGHIPTMSHRSLLIIIGVGWSHRSKGVIIHFPMNMTITWWQIFILRQAYTYTRLSD